MKPMHYPVAIAACLIASAGIVGCSFLGDHPDTPQTHVTGKATNVEPFIPSGRIISLDQQISVNDFVNTKHYTLYCQNQQDGCDNVKINDTVTVTLEHDDTVISIDRINGNRP